MKRLCRSLFNLAAAVSLILCVTLALAWIRSYWRSDWLFYWLKRPDTNTTFHLILARGELIYVQRVRPGGLIYIEERTPNELEWRTDSNRSLLPEVSKGWLQIQRYTLAEYQVGRPYIFGLVLRLPCWMLITTAAVASFGSYVAARRLNQISGCCAVCGYDLRATPDRCPECGTPRNTAEARRA